MKLANPFPLAVRLLFIDCHACWECGQNGQKSGGLELHHIWGRISSSALNAAVLCKKCHERMNHNREEHHRLLRKTIHYLHSIGYKLLPIDLTFLEVVKTDLRGFSLMR